MVWVPLGLILALLAVLGEPPEQTGMVADKAFFDDLSGNLCALLMMTIRAMVCAPTKTLTVTGLEWPMLVEQLGDQNRQLNELRPE